jgi:pre-mRNA-processing factor 39
VAELRTTEETEAAAQAKAAEPAEVPIPDAEEPAPAGEVEGAVAEPEMLPESMGAEELEKFLAVRDAYYKAAKESDAKIVTYENAIRRPYFHVKPLDDGQLGNWHRYLDFIEKEGVTDKVSLSRWYGFELWSMNLYTSCSFL